MKFLSRVRLSLWLVSLMLACLVAQSASTAPALANLTPASTFRSSPKIAPRVLAALDAGGEADVLVFVRGRPDLTPARALLTKEAKGRFVFDALRTTAERSQAELRRLLDRRGVEYQAFWIANVLRVRATSALIAEIAARREVEKIDINQRFVALDPDQLDPFSNSQLLSLRLRLQISEPAEPPWGVVKIGAPVLWERGIRGQGIVVAGNDTGVDWDHEALEASYRGWNGQTADHNYNWHDAWAKTPLEPSDDYGHGSHTVGTVAGGGPNKIGVAPDAKWIACRNMDGGVGTPASYVDCFQFFLAPTDLEGQHPRPELAPDVINNSWYCPQSEGCFPGDPLWEDTIRPAVEALTEAGVAVVVSAGNDGPGCGTVHDLPAIYPQSLTVGAIKSDNGVAGFSSRGPVATDGQVLPAPELVAPGVAVLSSFPDNNYVELSGTSMAAPHVAGTIALVWSAQPNLIGHLAVTEQVLRASATPIDADTCGSEADGQPNNTYGWGVINADAAVSTAERLQELAGTVTDTAGSPLSGVDVSVIDDTWNIEVNLVTGLDGRYSTSLLPGDYRVVVNAAGRLVTSTTVTIPAEGPATYDVALAPEVATLYLPVISRQPALQLPN